MLNRLGRVRAIAASFKDVRVAASIKPGPDGREDVVRFGQAMNVPHNKVVLSHADFDALSDAEIVARIRAEWRL